MGDPTLRVDFLGDPARDRAPRISVEGAKGTTEPVELSDKERLVLAYLALEARAPERRSRSEVRNAVFGQSGDDDLDRARRSLEQKLADAGVPGVFRPYRRGADPAEKRDPRGIYSLREAVACDLAAMLALLEAGEASEARRVAEAIRSAQGGCTPLPLIDPRGPRKLPAKTDWYSRPISRFEQLAAEHLEWKPPSAAGKPQRRGGRGVRMLAAAAIAIVAVAVVAAFTVGGGPSKADHANCDIAGLTEPTEADLAALSQPAASQGTPKALPEIVVRSRPRSLAVSSEGIWLAQSTDASIWLIDPRLRKPVGKPYPVQGEPYAMAVAEKVIWATRDDGVLVAVDRKTGGLVKSFKYAPSSSALALGDGALWTNNYDGRYAGGITRIDPCTGDLEQIPVGDSANTVIFAFDALWVTDSDRQAVHRVDPETHEVKTVDLDVADAQDLGAGDGYIWVVHYGPKRVTRIDPETMRRVGPPIPIGAGGAGAAVGVGALWIPNYEGDSVTRVDLETLESDPDEVKVGVSPTDIAVGFGRVWVPNNDSEPPTVTPIDP